MSSEAQGFKVEFIKGEPPPKATTRSNAYENVVTALRQKPGVWAIVAQYPKTMRADSTAWTRAKRLKYAGCEAVARRNGEHVVVYARWPVVAKRA